jgi:DNA-binding transcriptional ArsR family regulator
MSNGNEFKRELGKISEEFTLRIIKLIQSMPVSQLAAIASAKPLTKAAHDSNGGRTGAKPPSKTASTHGTKAPLKRGPKSSEKPSKAAATKTPARKERRSRAYMLNLRRKILTVLAEVGDWMAASAIGERVSDGDISFPLKELRDLGLTEMDGERSKARYRISSSGRAKLAEAV